MMDPFIRLAELITQANNDGLVVNTATGKPYEKAMQPLAGQHEAALRFRLMLSTLRECFGAPVLPADAEMKALREQVHELQVVIRTNQERLIAERKRIWKEIGGAARHAPDAGDFVLYLIERAKKECGECE